VSGQKTRASNYNIIDLLKSRGKNQIFGDSTNRKKGKIWELLFPFWSGIYVTQFDIKVYKDETIRNSGLPCHFIDVRNPVCHFKLDWRWKRTGLWERRLDVRGGRGRSSRKIKKNSNGILRSFQICNHKFYASDQIKDDEVCWTCSTFGEGQNKYAYTVF
jgi:hypothetical protein